MKRSSPKPPKLAVWLLKRFFPDEAGFYTQLGDIDEAFNTIAKEKNNFAAQAWYWTITLRSIPYSIINSAIWRIIMLKNYLKIAIRNIKRYKGYSFINITGLAVGMACFILIMLYIKYELSYDRYHENADDIYRVVMKQHGNIWHGTDWWNRTPGKLKAALIGDYPEISRIARVYRYGGIINHGNKQNIENRFYIVEPEFLEIFTFPLIAGDTKTALSEPQSILITQEMAEKYFRDENPIAKILNLNGQYDFKVTGILKNMPDNSHFKFDFLASFKFLNTIYRGDDRIDNWGNNWYQTYIQIQKNIDRENFESKFPVSEDKYTGSKRSHSDEYHIQPLTDIHLKGHMNSELEANSDIRYVYLFSAVAFLIMLIACLNYINLFTARSAKRSKEVGVRKVVGASRLNLIRQFLGESIILSIIALSISIIFVRLLLPAFGTFVERELTFKFFGSVNLLLSLICTAVTVGIISGVYPAFFLSSFKPGSVIKNVSSAGSKANLYIRNYLVVFQFVISIVLLFCTIVIYHQLKYMNTKDLGFVKEHIIIVNIRDNLRKNHKSLKNELLQYAKISDITVSRHSPAYITGGGNAYWEGKTQDEDINFYKAHVDYNYLDFYGLKLLEGRNFSKEHTTDVKKAYILNKTAVDAIGWEDPVGRGFRMWEDGTVIGVVDDFHFHELRHKIKPLVIGLIDPDISWTMGCFSIKISHEDIPGTLTFIEKKYKEFSHEYPFTYSFLDDRIDRMYRSEQRLGRSFAYFTIIAIFIACLGLFGLALFTTEQRTKEIGIRKVMGASVFSIAFLLSKQFTRWVLIANIISWPIAYYAMNRWLQSFAYRTNLNVWFLIFSALATLAIALLTISYQSVKTALANPIESLRYE
jgi:putative ABC transport system permease protein